MIEKIINEIHRLKKELNGYSALEALDYIEAYINIHLQSSILPNPDEQPVLPGIDEEGIPGKDFIPVDWVDACERYGKWKIVKAEQSVEGLEEEIERFLESEESTSHTNAGGYDVAFKDTVKIARHFAEWGAEHLKL